MTLKSRYTVERSRYDVIIKKQGRSLVLKEGPCLMWLTIQSDCKIYNYSAA